MHTLKITGGMVYNPLINRFEKRDIAVDGKKIADYTDGEATYTVDAAGCYVTPGLIDYHCHLFSFVPSGNVPADLACLPYGVTTAVDAGSCGAPVYPSFHKLEVERAHVSIKAYLNIASLGILSQKCKETPKRESIDREMIFEMFQRYPGELVALKLRNSIGIIDAGDEEPLRTMVELGEELSVPVVAHMTNPAVSCVKAADILRPGDVFCHMYQGNGDTILEENGKVKESLWDARKRGVIFDACNGNMNFSFRIAEKAMEQGFLPDIISTDLTSMSFHKFFVHDMPRLLSKYIMMGMSLEDVLQRVTLMPAKQLNQVRELATLDSGTVADIAIFRLENDRVIFRDREGQERIGDQLLQPKMTIKDGTILWAQTGYN